MISFLLPCISLGYCDQDSVTLLRGLCSGVSWRMRVWHGDDNNNGINPIAGLLCWLSGKRGRAVCAHIAEGRAGVSDLITITAIARH